MPTYAYRCESCGHEFEEFQSIKAEPIKICPQCSRPKVRRLIGTGAAVLFKGSGFYENRLPQQDLHRGRQGRKACRSGRIGH